MGCANREGLPLRPGVAGLWVRPPVLSTSLRVRGAVLALPRVASSCSASSAWFLPSVASRQTASQARSADPQNAMGSAICRLTLRSSGRSQRPRLASLESGLGAPLSSGSVRRRRAAISYGFTKERPIERRKRRCTMSVRAVRLAGSCTAFAVPRRIVHARRVKVQEVVKRAPRRRDRDYGRKIA